MLYFIIWRTATTLSLSLSHSLSHTHLSLFLCLSVCLSVSPSLFICSPRGWSEYSVSLGQGIFSLLICSRNPRLTYGRCDRRRLSWNSLQWHRRIILGRHIINQRLQVCHKSRGDCISDGTVRTVPTCAGYRIKIVIIIYYKEYNVIFATVAVRRYPYLVSTSSRWVYDYLYTKWFV